MPYKYAYQGTQENIAKAAATDVPISTKQSIMLANFLRGKSVERAKRDLANIIKKSEAVPFTRFTEGAGHKPGVGPGKYPVKAAKAFLTLVNSVEANALDLGLGEDLIIKSIVTHQAARAMRYGRKRGRQRKATHIEIVVTEGLPVKKQTKKAPAKKSTKKPAAKKAPAKKTPAKTEKVADKKEAEEKPKEAKAPAKEESQ